MTTLHDCLKQLELAYNEARAEVDPETAARVAGAIMGPARYSPYLAWEEEHYRQDYTPLFKALAQILKVKEAIEIALSSQEEWTSSAEPPKMPKLVAVRRGVFGGHQGRREK